MPPVACGHGMPSAASCVTCMEDGPVSIPEPVRPERVIGQTITARFDGWCPKAQGCGDVILIGERISCLDPSGVWVHEGCAP